MDRISKISMHLLHVIVAIALAAMCILVFSNVVSRYLYHSIIWSEEVVRFLFVYLIFFGAIIAFKEKMHFQVDLVINRLPKKIQLVLETVTNLGILLILYFFLKGSLKLTVLNKDTIAPITKIPHSFMYGIGVVTSIAMALIIIAGMFKTFRKLSEKTDMA